MLGSIRIFFSPLNVFFFFWRKIAFSWPYQRQMFTSRKLIATSKILMEHKSLLGEKITRLLRCLNFWSTQLIRLSHIFFQVWNIRIQYSKTITRSFSKVSSISHQGLWKVSTRSQEGVRKWLDSFRVLCPRVANSQLTFYWEYSQTFFRETTASNLFLSSYQ